MKKSTREETLALLEKEITDITKLLIFSVLLMVLLFINPKITLILTYILFALEIMLVYSKINAVPHYVDEFHHNDFKKFRDAHPVKGMSRQRYHLFLKCDFYTPTEDDKAILEYYTITNTRKAVLGIATFLLYVFSSVL